MPASSDDSPSLLPFALIAGVILWLAIGSGGDNPEPVEPVEPDPPVVVDLVSETFDKYERLFRETQGRKAALLRRGEFSTEADSVQWFASQDVPKQAFAELLDYEYEQFGGEKWTAEAEAKVAEQWAAGGAK